jgi:glycosyltransferase involved in cell wall biosynthesis
MSSIKVSIITSAMNRSSYLPRVWESLKKQNNKNFEWVIGNDGSIDGTIDLVKNLFPQSDFPITLVSASKRIGKSMIDNHAIAQAKGEYIILCDSDDWLEKNAIDEMLNSAAKYDSSYDSNFLGIIGLSKDNLGKCKSAFPEAINPPLSLNDLFYKYGFQEDCAILFKRAILRSNPFPEVDFYTPEGSVWSKIGHMKVGICNKIILNKEYQSDHAISFTNLFIYSRGKALSLALIYRNLLKEHTKGFNKPLDIFTYIRFSLHGDVHFKEMFLLFKIRFWAMMIILLPIAYAYSKKDILQGRVIKTHIDFQKSSPRYKLAIDTSNNK